VRDHRITSLHAISVVQSMSYLVDFVFLWQTRKRERPPFALALAFVVSQQRVSGTGAQILASINVVFADMEEGPTKARLGHVCLVSACNTLIGSGLECKEGRTVSVSCFVDALLAILNPFQVILFVFNYCGSYHCVLIKRFFLIYEKFTLQYMYFLHSVPLYVFIILQHRLTFLNTHALLYGF
jgi:hypothetical protein